MKKPDNGREIVKLAKANDARRGNNPAQTLGETMQMCCGAAGAIFHAIRGYAQSLGPKTMTSEEYKVLVGSAEIVCNCLAKTRAEEKALQPGDDARLIDGSAVHQPSRFELMAAEFEARGRARQ